MEQEVDRVREKQKEYAKEKVVDKLKQNVKQIYDKKGYCFWKEQERIK